MTTTGSVPVQGNLTCRDIITGLKIDSLNFVFTSLDELARLAGQSEVKFRPGPGGGLELVAAGQLLQTLPGNLLQAFRRLPQQATDLPAEDRYRCYAGWLLTYLPEQPPAARAARDDYIPLGGRLSWDWEDEGLQGDLCALTWVGEGPQRQLKREPLADVTEAVEKYPAFVLLGAPGSGKSTVLRRLVRHAAQTYLADASTRLPLFVELGSYHWERQSPEEFARAEWAGQVTTDFVELARQGRLLLLADGLNEMPYLPPQPAGESQPAGERAADWKAFIGKYFAEAAPGSGRAILSSRDQSDYDQPLGLPRVEIEPLKPDQVARFAAVRLGGQAETFLRAVERLDLTSLARVPISLFVLTELFKSAGGELPTNKGWLFRAYADLVWRQLYPKASNPEREAHLAALAELGYAMQQQGESTILPAAELTGLLPAQVRLPKRFQPVATPAEVVFERAWRSGLLSLVSETEQTYKFGHQLVQEQFAARALLTRWQAGETLAEWWQTARTPAEMPAPGGDDWEPLPLPPPTRWEQTTLLAAGITGRPDEFVKAVLAANPALAGRCLAEGGPVVSAETRAAVQQALLRDLSDPALHRRTRIQAGRVLAQVGDPRLAPVTINSVEVILPDLVEIPGGTATLGSAEAEAFDDEQPVHQVEVAAFHLARHPVTNAEYRCFIRAGGYDTEHYWTPAGWQWRQGQGETSGPVEDILQRRQYVLENPGLLEQLFQEGRLTPQARDTWQTLAEMSEEEARRQVSVWYPVAAHEQPSYWDDPAYNPSNQPVVGVTWYEAMAYCAWLDEQVRQREPGEEANEWPTGGLWDQIKSSIVNRQSSIRLPTEAEWEWAAGGPDHRRYPWGPEFDADKANTLEGRVLGTTPVGAYPAGMAPGCGALDLTGNVWEWTHSQYRPYPYRVDDGREEETTGTNVRYTVRGGSWSDYRRLARVSSRYSNYPVVFHRHYRVSMCGSPCLCLGFRLLVSACWFLVFCFLPLGGLGGLPPKIDGALAPGFFDRRGSSFLKKSRFGKPPAQNRLTHRLGFPIIMT